MTKEDKWLKRRIGMITASELGSITSASGKIIDGNIDFIRKVRWERNHGFSLPVTSRAMEIGKENEPLAIAWYRANYPDEKIIYSQELAEIPFWTNPDVPSFGASPDAFTEDETMVVEIKNVVGNSTIEFFFDPCTSYTDKLARVAKEHIDQILGQFISNPKVQKIRLVKYCAQNDDIMEDTDSPLAPWRGIVFDFERDGNEAVIADMIERIRLFNAFIASDMNPADLKKGAWGVDDEGKLIAK